MTSTLTVTGLSVSYGSHTVLSGIDLGLEAGGCVGIVGESGSGKSTLARCIVGLKSVDAGSIKIDNRVRNRLGPDVQMVFQDPRSSLNPSRRIDDIVAEPLAIAGGQGRRERRTAAADLLEQVGLDPRHVADRRSPTLSGGQAQRVAIARALAARPKLLVCDEAVSALDVSVQARVLNLLADIREQTGLSMVFITHDLAVVRVISDTLAVLDQGRIVEFGDTEEVIRNPHHSYTRTLIDAAPSLPSTPRTERT